METIEKWSMANGIHELSDWTIITNRGLDPVYINLAAQRALNVKSVIDWKESELLVKIIENIKKSTTHYQSFKNGGREYFSYYELIIDRNLKNYFRVVISPIA